MSADANSPRRCREGPLDGAPGGVTLDVAVRGDVFLIVQDDERVPNNWAVECDGPRREQDAEDDNQVLAGKQRPAPRTRFPRSVSSGLQHVLSREFGRGSRRLLYPRELSFLVASVSVSTRATSAAYLLGSAWDSFGRGSKLLHSERGLLRSGSDFI